MTLTRPPVMPTIQDVLRHGGADVDGEIDFSSLAPLSRRLAQEYAKIVQVGLPPGSIALAMFGATLNFYEAFNLTGALPELLRGTADLIEHKGRLS